MKQLVLLSIFFSYSIYCSQLQTLSPHIKPAPNAQCPKKIQKELLEEYIKETAILKSLSNADLGDQAQLTKVQELVIKAESPAKLKEVLKIKPLHIDGVALINGMIHDFEREFGIARPKEALQQYCQDNIKLSVDDLNILLMLSDLHSKRNMLLADAYFRTQELSEKLQRQRDKTATAPAPEVEKPLAISAVPELPTLSLQRQSACPPPTLARPAVKLAPISIPMVGLSKMAAKKPSHTRSSST